MKSVSEVIKTRRTVHSFSTEQVADELIREGLQHSLFAPNHKMTKPWKFIQVKGQVRSGLADVAIRLKSKKEPFSEIQKEAVRKKYLTEGSIVFFLSQRSTDSVRDRENYATLACAIQNFSLFMWNHECGTKWSTGSIIRDPKVFELLKVSSEEYEIVGLLWVGYPTQMPPVQDRGDLENYFSVIGSRL